MKTREEQAAAMRVAYLGDKAGDCISWDELKPCVRSQWLAALDYAALAPVTRVPFSDDQIERMARGLRQSYCDHYGITTNGVLPDYYKKLIRDAVLAGVAGGTFHPCDTVPGTDELIQTQKDVIDVVADAYGMKAKPIDPHADQVEALARVLHKSQDAFYCRYGDHATKFDDYTPLWRTMAHAAIAHLNTRPEGLPTAKSLGAIGREKYADLNRRTPEHYDEYHFEYVAKAILTALRPWLRDPVGCDLDVRAIDMANIMHTASVGAVSETWKDTAAQRILDLCRSRQKPVYECKECAKAEAECRQWRNANDELVRRATAARAALEGE